MFNVFATWNDDNDDTIDNEPIKRSQYAGGYSFGFFIDVFGDSLLLSPLLQI